MKTTLATILLFSFGLAGCDYVPFTAESRIAEVKAKIVVYSDNPTTVRWSDVKEHKGAVCGVFNSETRTASYGTELEWSGPQQFVATKGQPVVISNYSNCDTEVADWSRCANEGDEAKVRAEVEACKDFQLEELRRANEQIDRFFKSEGLVQSGDYDRDRRTWDERQAQIEKSPQGMDRHELSVRVNAWDVWDRAYNLHMRTVSPDAEASPKIKAAGDAVSKANAATEAYLREQGFR